MPISFFFFSPLTYSNFDKLTILMSCFYSMNVFKVNDRFYPFSTPHFYCFLSRLFLFVLLNLIMSIIERFYYYCLLIMRENRIHWLTVKCGIFKMPWTIKPLLSLGNTNFDKLSTYSCFHHYSKRVTFIFLHL